MTFTSDIKKELTLLPPTTGALLALIRLRGSLGLSGGLTLSITTENAATAQYIYKSLEELYAIRAEIRVAQKDNLAKNRSYSVFIEEEAENLLDELSLADSLMLEHGVPKLILNGEPHMQQDYLRGTFLAAGSLANPEKAYQLELASTYDEHAEGLQALVAQFNLHAHLSNHKNRSLLYLTRAEEISDFLTLIGAMQARLRFEDIKMLREMRGLANRQSNFETANITKTVQASQDVISAIDTLMAKNQLPESLTDIALARLAHPDASLQELGQLVTPPLSKSSVARRLHKLENLAHPKS
ncbi:MAG: DNA-binding protein WhiA [Streptococcaceae bacterium]|jgi:DNA-binding protein WhiA|nr:DNA-binding protein WhiA [Streptococcaceae bacterium]